MSDQLRKEKEVVGKKDDSALKLPKETEQRLIREFRSPFPEKPTDGRDSLLLANACWN